MNARWPTGRPNDRGILRRAVGRWSPRGWLPRSIFAQMVWLLVAAILVSKLGSWYAYMDERAFAVSELYVDSALTRTASLARLVQGSPPQVQQDMLDAASGPRYRFWISAHPILERVSDDPTTQALHERLQAQLRAAASEVRIKLASPRADSGEVLNAEGQTSVALKISVALGDGRWLNAATFDLIRPPGWNFFTTVSLLSSMLMVAAAALIIARRISRPLRSLAAAAESLGRGEHRLPLDEHSGPAEVRRAAAAFNAMRARLQRFIDDRTRMLAAISHDLRTPITSLRLRVELLEDSEVKTQMLTTLDELAQTTEATLAFASDEGGEGARAADLESLVESVCEDLAELGKPVSFAAAPTKLVCVCRPASLRRALRNLIENAVAYGGAARVRLEHRDGDIRILVDDDGPGIPGAELERVFEPFVRLEQSRNRRTGGVGLGLSIARSIARAHGGDVILANRIGGGLQAELSLPTTPTPA